nr:immunoglobulin light chain junction region [Macaca mulatta]MOV68569.1 immunoglobulin light chain junction region [Macaca mulatta]MOV69422.1 immunoglobulin light chain junction region [Macaca mulatta]MOV70791.1 immunoglobulin light chain junction region [Macaca mulatta]MOV70980.1 immunoglobulin light chain junction region [Macaca mulatta]
DYYCCSYTTDSTYIF